MKGELQASVTRTSSQQTPSQRFQRIQDHISTIESDNILNNVNYLNKFGITISKEPVRVQGRVLQAPKIAYANVEKDTFNAGEWDLKDVRKGTRNEPVQFLKPSKGIGKF